MGSSRLSTEAENRRGDAKPQKIVWLPVLVILVNLAGLGLLVAYSLLNLRPDLSTLHGPEPHAFVQWTVLLAVLAPAAASLMHVWPVLGWLRSRTPEPTGEAPGDVPATIAQRAANAPLALAAFSLLGWILVTVPAVVRSVMIGSDIPFGLAAHLVLRPVLAGLIAATATFFAAEYVCRTHVWPALLSGTRIAGNPRLRRVRVSHRLLVLWLAISVLPLGAVALTTYARVAGVDLATDPLLARVVSVVLLIAGSAVVGGAWLAWLVSRSIARPLETLETATARLREGRFDTRLSVSTTDELGSLAEGFNLMAGRLSQSYAELETRNRELAEALDRVVFLEHVKRGLDRFVPDAVRRAIEKDPESPALAKKAKDVTVLFLDIEGYSRLSEQLARPTLNALVERYFSLFLASIRAEGGDINETAGDGLMIIFQAGERTAHAASAVRAALAIQTQTSMANRDAVEGHPPIVVNIGISSGECDVGATRFHGPAGERWTFTASGPVTNLAARLGDHAYGGQILLAAETANRVGDRFPLRSLGPVSLKNLSNSVDAWEVQPDRPDHDGD
ncbi:MAG: HAMP domain-containing protein [Betaproteobacteria bacterium]|nr:HAMP domain-containing protein [Betaproteobacteria bacterium]